MARSRVVPRYLHNKIWNACFRVLHRSNVICERILQRELATQLRDEVIQELREYVEPFDCFKWKEAPVDSEALRNSPVSGES